MPRFSSRFLILGFTGLLGCLVIGALASGQVTTWLLEGVTVSRAEEDFRSLTQAVHDYQSATGTLPTTTEGLELLTRRPKPSPEKWVRPIGVVPVDPWGNRYRYRRLAADDPRHFEIYSLGPDGVPSEDDLSSLDER